ncbi:hypothetical protein [Moraxella cuniculi]|uniref:hypothetical protein n=1 Tax=Moraxella cuniculi TaxID=34061 RepID=UPI000F840293|nr:hypothetical protein [Moraxella cuniculi]
MIDLAQVFYYLACLSGAYYTHQNSCCKGVFWGIGNKVCKLLILGGLFFLIFFVKFGYAIKQKAKLSSKNKNPHQKMGIFRFKEKLA